MEMTLGLERLEDLNRLDFALSQSWETRAKVFSSFYFAKVS